MIVHCDFNIRQFTMSSYRAKSATFTFVKKRNNVALSYGYERINVILRNKRFWVICQAIAPIFRAQFIENDLPPENVAKMK